MIPNYKYPFSPLFNHGLRQKRLPPGGERRSMNTSSFFSTSFQLYSRQDREDPHAHNQTHTDSFKKSFIDPVSHPDAQEGPQKQSR